MDGRNCRERGGDLLSDTIAKVFLVLSDAEVDAGKNRYYRLRVIAHTLVSLSVRSRIGRRMYAPSRYVGAARQLNEHRVGSAFGGIVCLQLAPQVAGLYAYDGVQARIEGARASEDRDRERILFEFYGFPL